MKLQSGCIIALLASLPLWLHGQNRATLEFLPQLAWNGDFDDRWSWSVNTSMENTWIELAEDKPSVTDFYLTTFSLQAGAAFQLTNDVNLSGGYQFGWRDIDEEERNIEHRALQQLTYTQRLGKYRARARFRTEQRFFRNDDYVVEHRWRLRTSLDFPLQGEQLDPGETYLNAQVEWLANVFEADPWFFRDSRPYVGLGWLISEHYRLENGLEWRIRRSGANGEDYRQRIIYRLTFSFR